MNHWDRVGQLNPAEVEAARNRERGHKLAVFGLLYSGVFAFCSIFTSLGLAPILTARVAPFALAPLFVVLALSSHLRRKAPDRWSYSDRTKQPITFWIVLSFYWICAAGLVALGVWTFFRARA